MPADSRPPPKRIIRSFRHLPHSLWSGYDSNTVNESYVSAGPGISLDTLQTRASRQNPDGIQKVTVISSTSSENKQGQRATQLDTHSEEVHLV